MNWGQELETLKLRTLAVSLVLASLTPALAGAEKAPQSPAANDARAHAQTFGDWNLSCETIGTAPQIQRVCEIRQAVIAPNQNAPFAQTAFGRVAPNQPLMVTVVVPNNISFPSSVRIAVDEKDPQPAELAWRQCLPGGCFASLPVGDALLTRWRSLQITGRVTFKNGAGQDVVMPISFRGLADALNALAKEK